MYTVCFFFHRFKFFIDALTLTHNCTPQHHHPHQTQRTLTPISSTSKTLVARAVLFQAAGLLRRISQRNCRRTDFSTELLSWGTATLSYACIQIPTDGARLSATPMLRRPLHTGVVLDIVFPPCGSTASSAPPSQLPCGAAGWRLLSLLAVSPLKSSLTYVYGKAMAARMMQKVRIFPETVDG